jgi:16S rRNA processing protein RimM
MGSPEYDPDTISVGVFGRPHGVGGALALRPHNPGSRALDGLGQVLACAADGRRTAYDVASLRPVAGGYLIRLAGIDDREAAAALTLSEVRAPRAALPALAPGEYYVEDVVGCAVEDQAGRALGVARGTFWNGAHDVCTVVAADGAERLIPLVPDFVLDVDAPGRKMRVRWSDDD